MSFKEKIEKDPTQCKVLRRADRLIDDSLNNNKSQRDALFAKIRETRAKREKLQNRYDALKRQTVVAGTLSLLPGKAGAAISVSGSEATVEMALIASEIKELVRELQQHEVHNDRLNDEHSRLNRELARNSALITNLDCVRP